MTVDPGHFHASLVQRDMYPEVDPVVHVYAPKGKDVESYLNLVEQFNTRSENPTQWEEVVYGGGDFFDKMLSEKPGNVMVVAGNNQKKTEYILEAVKNDIHVYADKPMVIDSKGYELLKQAMKLADEKGLLVYDIMTERFEVTSMLQKRLSESKELFGEIVNGSVDNPAITKESVHHFFKEVNGKPLVRPAWFFDVEQQGAGIVDVATHLVDLILWSCFSGEMVGTDRVAVKTARQWTTALDPAQFKQVTGLDSYPGYLKKDVDSDNVLNVNANGEFVFTVDDIHGKVSVIWNFEAPAGTKDTHFSIIRGSKANLIIRQNAETNYQTVLFVEPTSDKEDLEPALRKLVDDIQGEFPGLGFEKASNGWSMVIPDALKIGHEAHFAQVTRKYLDFMKAGEIPAWEKQFILTKYFLTTQAFNQSKN
ncbi:putative oxidoreductase C-terminal domain-containing protein [Membranihabitans marinus]